MTTLRTVLAGVLLAFGVLSAAATAAGQRDPSDGVELRETNDLTLLDHLRILATRALIPGARVVAPLHRYPAQNVCQTGGRPQLIGHRGSAALVATMDETTFAFYYPSAADAIRSAWDYEWCNSNASTPPTGEYMVWRPEPNRWHFATTLPVNGWQANGHFVSLDIDAVEASIAAARTQHADQNEQPAGSQDPEH